MNPEFPFNLAHLIQICQENGVAEIRLFGSMANGTFTDNSDIDLLVRFSSPVSIYQMAHLKVQLSEALGRKIDLTTEAGLLPHLRDKILEEAILLYRA